MKLNPVIKSYNIPKAIIEGIMILNMEKIHQIYFTINLAYKSNDFILNNDLQVDGV